MKGERAGHRSRDRLKMRAAVTLVGRSRTAQQARARGRGGTSQGVGTMRRRTRRSAALDGCVVRARARRPEQRGAAAGGRDRVRERMRGMRTGGDAGTPIRCDRLVELVTDYLEGALDQAVAA